MIERREVRVFLSSFLRFYFYFIINFRGDIGRFSFLGKWWRRLEEGS